MANTVTQTTLVGSGSDKNIVRRINIISDGSEETNTVVFACASFGANTAKGRIDQLECIGSDAVCRLSWDQTTDSVAVSVNPAADNYIDFRPYGGLKNPNGSGATGDLLLNTANLDAGDEVTLVIHINQS